jgi:hypothetical protein
VRAHEYARAALAALDVPDFDEISSRLAQIAISLLKAHDLGMFNPSFAAAVTFIRRATLADLG